MTTIDKTKHPLEVCIENRKAAHNAKINASKNHRGIQVKSAAVISGAAATKQILQTIVANGGTMVQGTLTSGPITRDMVNQGGLADCYLLAATLAEIDRNPTFANAQIFPYTMPDGTLGAVVQYWSASANAVVQIDTSTMVSTQYDAENSGDIKVDLFEKTYGLFRTGSSDYNAANYGSDTEVFSAFGLNVSMLNIDLMQQRYTLAGVTAAYNAGKLLVFSTGSPTGNDPNGNVWVQRHVYGIGRNAAGEITATNPWFGNQSFVLTDAILAQPWITGIGVGTPVSPARLVAPAPPAPPAPLPVPVPPAKPTGAPMQLGTILPLPLASFTTDSTIKLETRGGRPDLGYFPDTEGGSIVRKAFPITTAGTYSLVGDYSALGTVSLTLTIGGQAFAFTLPPTGSWDVPAPFAVVDIVLAAATADITLLHHAGPQPDIFDGLFLVRNQ